MSKIKLINFILLVNNLEFKFLMLKLIRDNLKVFNWNYLVLLISSKQKEELILISLRLLKKGGLKLFLILGIEDRRGKERLLFLLNQENNQNHTNILKELDNWTLNLLTWPLKSGTIKQINPTKKQCFKTKDRDSKR